VTPAKRQRCGPSPIGVRAFVDERHELFAVGAAGLGQFDQAELDLLFDEYASRQASVI